MLYTIGLFILAFVILLGYKFYYNMVINWKKEKKGKTDKRFVVEALLPTIFLFVASYFIATIAIRPYLMSHPEILREMAMELANNQQKDQRKKVSSYVKEHKDELQATAPAFGKEDASVTIYEFYDYSCSACKMASKFVKEYMEKDADVKIVLKNYPIRPFSFIAAQASIAAKAQGADKVKALHEAMFEEGIIPAKYNDIKDAKKREDSLKKKVFEIAKKAGLDTEKLEADMNAESVMVELRKTREAGSEFGIEGTPFFVIGDNFYPGAMTVQEIEKAVKEAR